MLAWINLFVLVLSIFCYVLFYVRSVSPATLEKLMGEKAYDYCAKQRVIAIVFMVITLGSTILYTNLPVENPLPNRYPWPLWVSLVIAAVISLPALWLMGKGMLDAGSEAIRPAKENPMYGGIYEHLRHPQAMGEVLLWFAIAFICHSPFLAVLSLVQVPVFFLLCFAEEQDLLVRFGDDYAQYIQRV